MQGWGAWTGTAYERHKTRLQEARRQALAGVVGIPKCCSRKWLLQGVEGVQELEYWEVGEIGTELVLGS